MSPADTGDDTVVSKRRPVADETVMSARRQAADDTVVSQRERAGDTIEVPNTENDASRRAHAPRAEALRSPAPVRAVPPGLISQRARVPDRGQLPSRKGVDRDSVDRAVRARARQRVLWLLGGGVTAAAAAAGLLALLLLPS